MADERETIVNKCKSFIRSLEPTHKHTIFLWFIFNRFRRRFHSVFYGDILCAYCLLPPVACTTYNWPSEKRRFHIKRTVEFNRIHSVLLGLVQSYVSCDSSIAILLYHHWVINGEIATFIWSRYRNVDVTKYFKQYPNRLKMMGNIRDLFPLPPKA